MDNQTYLSHWNSSYISFVSIWMLFSVFVCVVWCMIIIQKYWLKIDFVILYLLMIGDSIIFISYVSSYCALIVLSLNNIFSGSKFSIRSVNDMLSFGIIFRKYLPKIIFHFFWKRQINSYCIVRCDVVIVIDLIWTML